MAQKNLATYTSIEGSNFTTGGSFVVIQNGQTRLLSRQEMREIVDLIATVNIPNDAVTNTKIADNAVTNTKIANGAVTTSKIADGAISFGKILAGSVQTSSILTGSVIESTLANAAVTSVKMADNAVTNTKIANNAVTTSKIADGAVTEGKIGAGAVTTTKIGDNAISTAKTNAVAYGVVGYGDTGGGLTSFGAIFTGNQNPSFEGLNGSNYFTATASGYDITFTEAQAYVFSATQRRSFGDVGYTSTNVRNLAVETLTNTVRIIVLDGAGNPTTLDQTNDWCFNLVGIRQNI